MRLYPGLSEELAAEDVYAGLTFPRPDAAGDAPYVAINMVSTLDGKVSVGGKANQIGGGVDRQIMRNIRSKVDAVLVGAGSVRAEEMNLRVTDEQAARRKAEGLPEQPLAVILAGSNELPLWRGIFRSREAQRLAVVAGGAAPESTLREASDLGVDVLRAEGSYLPEPHEVLRLLKERRDVATVLLEGGPTVNGSFLSSGAVDELFLTLSPKIFSSPQAAPPSLALATGTSRPFDARFDLASVHSSPHEGELYLRYLCRRS